VGRLSTAELVLGLAAGETRGRSPSPSHGEESVSASPLSPSGGRAGEAGRGAKAFQPLHPRRGLGWGEFSRLANPLPEVLQMSGVGVGRGEGPADGRPVTVHACQGPPSLGRLAHLGQGCGEHPGA